LDEAHQLVVGADDVNLLDENINTHTMKENTETRLYPSKEAGL